MAELRGRAKLYARVLYQVSQAEGLTGKQASLNRGARFLSYGVRLDDPRQIDKALSLGETLALATNTPVVTVHRRAGIILYQFQLAGAFWETYTRSDLVSEPGRAGVGLAEGRQQIDFDFDAPHSVVAGITGSGKTETVKTMLVGLFTAYSPDELQAIIIDLKGKYSEFDHSAHLRGMPIAHSDSEIDNSLYLINQQIKERETSRSFSSRRLLLIVDEAEAIFCNRSRLQIGQALVKRGREVRINGLFATQEPHKGQFGKHLFGQIAGRWAGLVSDANSSFRITGRAGLECHRLTGQGDFVRLKAGGLHDRLQVAMATKQDYDSLPRADIETPEVTMSEPLDPDVLPEEDKSTGRPKTEIDPEIVAYYLAKGPSNVTQKAANEELGLGKLLHYRYREFAERMLMEFKRLRKEQRNGGR